MPANQLPKSGREVPGFRGRADESSDYPKAVVVCRGRSSRFELQVFGFQDVIVFLFDFVHWPTVFVRSSRVRFKLIGRFTFGTEFAYLQSC